jgi:hypothetical protein
MDEFIILSRQDLRAAMRFGDYVEAIADGFRLLAEGRCASPVPTQIDVAHRHRIRARATDLLHGRWLPGRLRTADGWTGRRVLAAVMDTHPGYSRSVFRRLLRRIRSEEMGYALALLAPARKYEFDLARALVDEGDLLLDDEIAEAAQLRRQSLRFGGQRVKFDLRGYNAINRNRKAAACERRRLLRDQLRDLYLLIHREEVGLLGGRL